MPNFPPALLVDGRRLPGNVDSFRRLVRALDVQPGERVLLIGAGEGAMLKLLAREAGANVTALEWEPKLVAACEARVRDEALSGRVAVRQGDFATLPAGSFEVVILDSLPPKGELARTAQQIRELLVINGRAGFMLPTAVGISTAAAVSSFWSEELGAPFARPVALMSQVERAGYEPMWAESLADDVMAEYYRVAEERLPNADPALAERQKQAIELFRNAGGRAGSTFVMIVGRRREPGEKPPRARTSG